MSDIEIIQNLAVRVRNNLADEREYTNVTPGEIASLRHAKALKNDTSGARVQTFYARYAWGKSSDTITKTKGLPITLFWAQYHAAKREHDWCGRLGVDTTYEAHN
jgi:hypothetical protein